MAGKPKNKDLIKLDDVTRVIFELIGVKRTRSTVYNWAKNGRASYAGVIIKLRTTMRLRRLYTTRQWVLDFIKEIG